MTTLQEAYDMIDRVLRNTLYDDDYAEHSAALDLLSSSALAQQGEQQPVCHGCGIPAGDVHMSTCKSGKWPSRVSNGNTAAPQAHPSRDVTEFDESQFKSVEDLIAHLNKLNSYRDKTLEALSKYKGAK